jgi:hypothetical protein
MRQKPVTADGDAGAGAKAAMTSRPADSISE